MRMSKMIKDGIVVSAALCWAAAAMAANVRLETGGKVSPALAAAPALPASVLPGSAVSGATAQDIQPKVVASGEFSANGVAAPLAAGAVTTPEAPRPLAAAAIAPAAFRATASPQAGNDGSTDLMKAVDANDFDRVKTELDKNPDPSYINAANVIGTTALMKAAFVGNPDIVRLLLFRGADPNLQDASDGWNALMYTMGSKADPAQLANTRWALLNAKAIKLDQATHFGFTILSLAVVYSNGDPEFVSTLLDFADKHHLDVRINALHINVEHIGGPGVARVNALDDANARGHWAVGTLLAAYGAKPSGRLPSGVGQATMSSAQGIAATLGTAAQAPAFEGAPTAVKTTLKEGLFKRIGVFVSAWEPVRVNRTPWTDRAVDDEEYKAQRLADQRIRDNMRSVAARIDDEPAMKKIWSAIRRDFPGIQFETFHDALQAAAQDGRNFAKASGSLAEMRSWWDPVYIGGRTAISAEDVSENLAQAVLDKIAIK